MSLDPLRFNNKKGEKNGNSGKARKERREMSIPERLLKLTEDEIEDICFDDSEEFPIVDNGEWIDDGKYSYKSKVFKFEGRFFKISFNRSGSYFSDYHYSYPDANDIYEVEKKTIAKEVWEAVKDQS